MCSFNITIVKARSLLLFYFKVIPLSFSRRIQELVGNCERYLFHGISSRSETLISQLEATLLILEEGIQLLSTSEYVSEHSLLLGMRADLSKYLRLMLYGFNDCTVPPVAIASRSVHYSGNRGRPRIVINLDRIELLRSCGYTWTQVANALQVGRTTLWRCLRDAGVQMCRYIDISDDELDTIVRDIQRENPNCGQQLICGYLRDRGINVQRHRLRESVARTDPLRRMVRWHQVVSRRTYSVERSNSLWHIDGHHSLIRWRFVVHGGIDGYSRMVVFLACSTNNRSLTVYKLF